MMNQTDGTYVVDDGALMSGEQCITISRCKVTIEPIDGSASQKIAELEERAIISFTRMDRAATRLMKWVVVAFALYFACILIHAFTSGAFERLVG